MTAQAQKPAFPALFTPKLVTVLRENYGAADFRADVIAGLTVAIVALPLSMAIAIASGVTPDRGLYTSIIGGFVVSALGGSRFQIAGPAGAFIVLVAATVARHGIEGVILATLLSGFILAAIGFLRLGTFIKYIPYPVTVGFTSGIAVIIFASQIKELLGLTLHGSEPAPLLPKIMALTGAVQTISPAALAISLLSIVTIVLIKKWRPHWPSFLIAVFLASAVAALLGLPVATIGSKFGGIPHALPMPVLPEITTAKVMAVLPDALSFALLGGIEGLLSAVVADSMTGRRHRSNCELVAQGAGNIASALFGGICVTGNIARTATNVRAGARSPVSGMMHSLFLLAFMLLAAPLASYIPLAALAGVLAVVAWNMAEVPQFITLLRISRGEAAVLVVTFLLVVFRDLTEGILVGFGLGALLFIHRMANAVEVEHRAPVAEDDLADDDRAEGRTPYAASLATDPDILVYRISGAFFFGAAAAVESALDRIGEHPRAYVIDFSGVPVVDSTAVMTIESFARRALRHGALIYISGARQPIRRHMLAHGIKPPRVHFKPTLAEALTAARAATAQKEPADATAAAEPGPQAQ
jgi:SulP family sulfate permease